MRRHIKVVAAIIEKDGRILIAQRNDGDKADKWEFPGGKYEPGETGKQAVEREIREEFDSIIEAGELVCTIHHRYSDFDLEMDCFRCRLVSGSLHLLEHSALRWIDPKTRGIPWLAADRKVIREYKKYLKEKGE